MSYQILINIVICIIWVLLQDEITLVNAVVGYTIGLASIYTFRRLLGKHFYAARLLKSVVLLLVFIKEVIIANIIVMMQILSPRLKVRPGIFALPLAVTRDWQITLLANMITLTPGTLSVEISPDHKTLYVHALDIDDPQEMAAKIKRVFERRILEVSG